MKTTPLLLFIPLLMTSGALAAGQDHCDHFFCHNCSPLKLVYLHGPHRLRVAAGTALTHQTFTIPLPVFWAWLFLPLWAF